MINIKVNKNYLFILYIFIVLFYTIYGVINMVKKKKKRTNKKLFGVLVIILLVIGIIVCLRIFKKDDISKNKIIADKVLSSYVGKNISDLENFGKDNDIEIEVIYQYDDEIEENIIISQDIEKGTKLNGVKKISVVVSKGKLDYNLYNVNELGEVPVMMYHGIKNMSNSETKYTGGNVDRDGYTRTSEAFRQDLEFYYEKGYRMVSLDDFVDGNIDVEVGKSPIILTFDDGNDNNIKILGKDDKGNLEIDPNSAVGILEEFKKKYPDYNVTATFFVNETLFNQGEYDNEILKWLVDNGYDVGNHTISHVNFTKVNYDTSVMEVGKMYKILNDIIPGKYVEIVALPFGSPYNREHSNYPAIIDGEYDGYKYHTKAGLRVGWKASESVFDKEFDASFIKRIRAYDNNGIEFDIEMNFKLLENNKYISDGNKDTIVVKESDKDRVIDTDKKIIAY